MELLVVIAIIGIMATVALVSLNSARIKARDSKRAADIREISLALELCYDENGKYLSTTNFPTPSSPLACGGRTFITSMQADPEGNSYFYGVDSESKAQKYVLGSTMEIKSSMLLKNDVDGAVYGVNCDDPVYCIQP